MFCLGSPLEQFKLIKVLPINLIFFDFSITNSTLVFILAILVVSAIFAGSLTNGSYLYFFPKRFQYLFEQLFYLVRNLVLDNIGKKGQKFFPIVFTFFTVVLILNLIGLVPYSYTVTSFLSVTLSFSFVAFVGTYIIAFQMHGLRVFSMFLPSGVSITLGFLLIPLELISFFFKPISLAVRLFANMTAGHILLKVIAGFGWNILKSASFFSIFYLIPAFLLCLLIGLEFCVAIIQTFVFSILICIYINEILELH